ncbi:MAG: sugar phosphate isomerase/epimerase [Ramlibacter sp.]|nr:sugar phosphate isomerase/epimerase [Ramlibacter sp.]
MSNRIGVHALVWVGGWSEAEAHTAISASAKAGFDLIELAALNPETFNAQMTASLLSEYRLQAAVSLGLDEYTDVSSDDDQIVAAGRARLALALNLVRDIGANYLGGVIYSRLGRYAQPVTARGRANSIDSIAWLADKAAASGITLGLEFCNRYETNVLNTTAQTLQFIEEIGRSNVMAHLDTYHMNIEEESFRGPVLAAAAAGKLGYVHVGESNRGALGNGSIAWAEFFSALREVNYGGIITFESFSSKVVHPTLSANLSIWRDLWTDSMELATAARAFIREGYGC